jgi:malate synthase
LARRGGRMRARRKVRKRFMDTVETGGLSVAKALYDFMNDEALPETGLTVERFWDGLGAIIRGFAPRNRKLLNLRRRRV